MSDRILQAAAIVLLLARAGAAEVTLDLGTAQVRLDERGYVRPIQLADEAAGPAGPQPAMMIETDRGEHYPKSLTLAGDRLTAVFEGAGTAEWSVARHKGFVILRLTRLACERPVKRLRVFALPVPEGARVAYTLNAAHVGDWTLAVMGTSLNVHAEPAHLAGIAVPADSRPAPAAAVSLVAQTHDRHGLEPAGVALVACRQSEWLDTIQRMEQAAGLPSPRPGGEWNKRSPWIRRSYFFLTDFREAQFEQALAIARRGGFHTILLGQESWCETTGHYQVNRERFPDGIAGLQRVVDRFREAGFRVGLHFLAASIYPPDPYVTPVPDPRLVKDATATLAADIDEKAEVVPVTAAPSVFPAEDGGYEGPGAVLQVGNELIWYESRSVEAPFAFRGCQRGYLGTKAAPHRQGEPVAHVLKAYGYFLYDMDSTILPEIADAFAKVANAVRADMLYFDGAEKLQGDHWYYNALLIKTIHDRLVNKDVLLQASSFSHYSWHLLARSASADGHGDIKGYLDERSSWFDSFARDGMPLDVGWYYGYDPTATPDLFEYVLGATIGYDASMSFQVSVAAAERHPFTGEILDLIARYERLRLSGRVPVEMRQRLRIPAELAVKMEPAQRHALLEKRREYRLMGTGDDEAFQRVGYEPWHDVNALDGRSNAWPVRVAQGPARCGLQIEALPGPWLAAGPSYHSAGAVLLEAFEDLGAFEKGDHAVFADVTQTLARGDDPREGKGCAVYTATSARAGADGWSYVGRRFDPPLNLAEHRAIGFWMRGDGRGGAFKLQLRDDKGATDYYIQNDYVGWRYQQLARPEADPIDYRQVRYLGLYYNGLPGRTTVTCAIDGVKALPALDRRVVADPRVEVAGRQWAWKGELREGQHLSAWPGEPIRRYGQGLSGPELSPASGEVIVLDAGDHTARFGCSGELTLPVRVRWTLQPPERHTIR